MYAPIDGSVPKGYPVKGQTSTMLYYPRGAKFYSRVVADVYFDTDEAAEHAGFTRWDRRGSAAYVIRPNADE
jgi:large subunit ribosomal protein L17